MGCFQQLEWGEVCQGLEKAEWSGAFNKNLIQRSQDMAECSPSNKTLVSKHTNKTSEGVNVVKCFES